MSEPVRYGTAEVPKGERCAALFLTQTKTISPPGASLELQTSRARGQGLSRKHGKRCPWSSPFQPLAFRPPATFPSFFLLPPFLLIFSAKF